MPCPSLVLDTSAELNGLHSWLIPSWQQGKLLEECNLGLHLSPSAFSLFDLRQGTAHLTKSSNKLETLGRCCHDGGAQLDQEKGILCRRDTPPHPTVRRALIFQGTGVVVNCEPPYLREASYPISARVQHPESLRARSGCHLPLAVPGLVLPMPAESGLPEFLLPWSGTTQSMAEGAAREASLGVASLGSYLSPSPEKWRLRPALSPSEFPSPPC